jgi:hypothetical protein
MEGWKNGRTEEWKIGRVEDWNEDCGMSNVEFRISPHPPFHPSTLPSQSLPAPASNPPSCFTGFLFHRRILVAILKNLHHILH